ncbi:MAG: hypothetical protein M1827_002339 [Pycnora praestabilis]|nr:MAG: hypothetical protein M1827_002339 [Pycnora praestabilis]
MGGSSEEFPLLEAHGLYAADIRGDGNCLFNALSDQLYGTQNEHHAIRTRVIAYMREHASYYKQFIDVQPGGGVRRNPKRKNAGAYSTPINALPPSAEEVERVFESHLQSMARGGTYGDNMEISAFSAAFEVDVKIYQRDFAYMISALDKGMERDVAHIAYHVWEHYSSIRNISGPHTGPPEVEPATLSPADEKIEKERLSKTPYVLPWMVDVVVQSLPYLADRVTIRRTLEECKGSVDNAVSKLLDAEERGSVSSTQESSSVEREPDSDEEALSRGPNKKQDRRLSRATKTVVKEKEEQRKRNFAIRLKEEQPDESKKHDDVRSSSLPRAEQYTAKARPAKVVKEEDGDETEDEDWRPAVDKDDDSTSNYSSESRSQQSGTKSDSALTPQTKPKVQVLKLNGPRQKQPGPQKTRVSARERKDLKKAAQKAAAKERKKGVGGGGMTNGVAARKNSVLARTNGKENTPGIEMAKGMRTLYI